MEGKLIVCIYYIMIFGCCCLVLTGSFGWYLVSFVYVADFEHGFSFWSLIDLLLIGVKLNVDS